MATLDIHKRLQICTERSVRIFYTKQEALLSDILISAIPFAISFCSRVITYDKRNREAF